MKKTTHCRLLWAALLAFALPAFSGEDEIAKKDDVAQVKTQAWANLYAVRDATTEKLRPMTESERLAAGLPNLLNRKSDGLKVTRKSDGTEITILEGFQSVTLIKRNADGTFTTTCVDTQEAVNKFRQREVEKVITHVK